MVMAGDKIRKLCVGHPDAVVAWPHRPLHEAADMMDRIGRALLRLREHAHYENVMHAHSRVIIPADVFRELALIHIDITTGDAELISPTPEKSS